MNSVASDTFRCCGVTISCSGSSSGSADSCCCEILTRFGAAAAIEVREIRFPGWLVCTNVTVCFSSLLPSDSILNACGRLVMMRVARCCRSCEGSGCGVDVMTSLVGDADPCAVTVPSFCCWKKKFQLVSKFKRIFNVFFLPIPLVL
jgi:hypothetical protein